MARLLHEPASACERELCLDYGGITALAYVGTALHLLLIPYFALIGAYPLAALNIGSSMIWAYCTKARRREANRVVQLALAEVYIHAAACVAMLGLSPGFQYYLWGCIPFIMFNPRWSARAVIATVLLFALTFALGSWLAAELPYRYAFAEANPYWRLGNIVIAFGALTLGCYHFRSVSRNSQQRLHRLANTDPLTGLYNRRRMSDGIRHQFGGAPRAGTLIIAIGDIDHFKSINDSHGHDCGDVVICEVATRLRRHLRKHDFVARWGGDEFLIVLADSDTATAKTAIEKIRSDIANAPVRYGDIELHVSMTFGIAQQHDGDTFNASVRRADRALYRGKECGRGCIVVDDSTTTRATA